MEGKAVLFKEFGDIDAWPVCLATKDVDEIVPHGCGDRSGLRRDQPRGHLRAPLLEVERRLRELLDRVFHDDQHGTAIVTLAAFINALQVVGKRPGEVRVVMTGAARAEPPSRRPPRRRGPRPRRLRPAGRPLPRPARARPRQERIRVTDQPHNFAGSADEALEGADVYIGLSAPGAVSVEAVRRMADEAIVFAMANPTPEVMPEEIDDVAAVVATGRSIRTRSTTCSLSRRLPRSARRTGTRDHAGDGACGCRGAGRCRRARRAVRRLHRAECLRPEGRADGREGCRRGGGALGVARRARSKARPAISPRSRRSPACSLGSQPPGREAGPDLDDARAKILGRQCRMSSGLVTTSLRSACRRRRRPGRARAPRRRARRQAPRLLRRRE